MVQYITKEIRLKLWDLLYCIFWCLCKCRGI